MMEMNSHLDRISHFKGIPYEIGFAAGQKLVHRLVQIIDSYTGGVAASKDLQKLRSGTRPWLHGLPMRFQAEFEGMVEGANVPLQSLAEWAYIEECDANQCSSAIYQVEDKV
jgi:hypothetical protein